MLKRHAFCLASAMALLTLFCHAAPALAAQPKFTTKRPNILFLFTDDQQADTISALGNPHIQTPNLDRLAQSGMVFNNAYCMGGFCPAVCLPSRMMTLYGQSLFKVQNLYMKKPNLALTMNNAKYVCWHIGKWGNTPKQVHGCFTYSQHIDGQAVRNSGYPGRLVADKTIDFLNRWADGQEGQKPFFAYLAFAGPHDPRIAAQEYLDRYDVDKIPLPPNFMPFHPFDNGEMGIRDEKLAPWPRTPEEIRKHIRDYYACITCMDEQIGRVLQTLRDIGAYDSTIIIFSSDQGLALGSHGLMGKQNLYEPSMRVPLIFAGPSIVKGRKSEAFVYLADLFPTICDLVNEKIPTNLDGLSFAPVLRGRAHTGRPAIFLAYRDFQRAVRQGDWKLIRYPQVNRVQLFNLKNDPHETRNLADDPAYADKIRELTALLKAQQKQFEDPLDLNLDGPVAPDINLDFFQKFASGK